MISPKLHPKPSHRRIYSDCSSNIYKQKIVADIKNIEIKNIEKDPIHKKPQKKLKKDQIVSKSTTKLERNPSSRQSPLQIRNDIEKQILIQYITQYFSQYNDIPITSIEFYKVLNLIGKGAFGKVLLCEHKLTGKKVAIKAISKAHLQSSRSSKKVFQEVYILRKIKSRFVIKILEVFESEKNFLMVLEYAGGGDLLHYVRNKGKLKEEEAKKIFKQIVQGAMAIHDAGILHRDFKLDNILLDSHCSNIKICDFGVSKILRPGETIIDQCGTPAYLAPEIIKNLGYEGFSVDVWSLGVVLYTMICGTIPFKASSLNDLHKVILTGVFEVPGEISDLAKDLMRIMIVVEPNARCTLEDVLKHPWFLVKNIREKDKSLPQFCPRILKERGSEEIRESVVSEIVEMGFSYEYIKQSLKSHQMNHATATYYLMI